jgi:hypothetical protein
MASLGDDLLQTVNKLQDLVFNTIGNDSLDLPQIVSPMRNSLISSLYTKSNLMLGWSRSLSVHNPPESPPSSKTLSAEISYLEAAALSPADRLSFNS